VDCWFPGDATGHYYLHGPSGCVDPYTLTAAQWEQARRESLCYGSLSLADEHYAHIYVHHGNNDWRNPAYGLRFERYRYWWPEKPMWITEYGHPNRHFLTQPGAEQALIEASEYIRDEAPYVRSAALWILGDNPQWGGEMYGPQSGIVGRLATTNTKGVTLPQPEPAAWLPSTDTLTCDAVATGELAQIWPKRRWWNEQAVRDLENGQTDRALAILRDMATPGTGLDYVIEDLLSGR